MAGYPFESPQVNELESGYYCVAVEVEAAFKPQGEVGCYRFPAMLVADVEMREDIDLEIRLLQGLRTSTIVVRLANGTIALNLGDSVSNGVVGDEGFFYR